ncbi:MULTISPECIES: STAS domain-containing protein [Flavobacterium]|uniref:STAS domain-containing protein n=2 Tax=Flavobacterium TaxID=237 RepID=A0AA94F411_9FLAO|nr:MULTISPECIES: STAS domain-containing protein [Flavobacterium]OXA83203.1 hypothetical protein B0A56_02140 [Flavobacterium columnare NBRC 100251 = ATCC 23463]AMA47986.1 hypothetical protein AWN65_00170 [Flavobacterium covae]AND63872.1 hypothetical protein AX766_05295 [Flavobacterium covae]MCH4829883.1 hypothetical protein [Flavobacterium columnare]MCH4832737.1 hypothetical protein [Flavobacterium columnare]
MSLKITYNSGVYEINGNMGAQNVNSVINYFNSLIGTHPKEIQILFEKNQEIDRTCVRALYELYKKAITEHVVFRIFSKSKKIEKMFNDEKINHILRKVNL